jgi:hypothetical protein
MGNQPTDEKTFTKKSLSHEITPSTKSRKIFDKNKY